VQSTRIKSSVQIGTDINFVFQSKGVAERKIEVLEYVELIVSANQSGNNRVLSQDVLAFLHSCLLLCT
jgi:hypothetical protein